MKIFLLRHLPTNFNIEKRYMGKTYDEPILESSRCGFKDFLRNNKIDIPKDSILVSSPLKRALQTLTIAKEERSLNSKIIVDRSFEETDYGKFEGLHKREVLFKYPDIWDTLVNDPMNVRLPEGESLVEVSERVVGGVNKLLDQYGEDSTILLASHVDVIKAIILMAMGSNFHYKKNFYIDNGSISLVTIEKGIWKVKFMNIAPELEIVV